MVLIDFECRTEAACLAPISSSAVYDLYYMTAVLSHDSCTALHPLAQSSTLHDVKHCSPTASLLRCAMAY